ncbi:MAG TPA: efflux RND transporter periplasmic adaptor subunit [Polyangia bacterium]|jgi:HlyD family secretion protein/macrolide-specific efflux system membrane fusion protein
MANGSRKRRRWIAPVVVLVIIGIVVAVFAKRGGAGPKELDPSLITTVKRSDLAIEVLETGKVQPREKVDVKSKVAGQVLKVFVDAGVKVKKGQLLLQLDPIDYERNVAKTEADVAAAKNALEFSELTLDRRQKGLAERGVAQIDVDTALSDVKAKKVAVQTAEVTLNAATDQLHYTRITAPIDGTVTERVIQPGETVVPGVQATFDGKALLTVSDLSTLIVKADLNQIDVAKVKMGQKVKVTFDALPDRTYDATITKIAPASVTPDAKSGSTSTSAAVDVFPVEATLDKADTAIKPGMTADVRIHIEKRDHVIALPIEAVVKESGKQYVTKVIPLEKGKQKTEKTEVTVGARNDREIEIVKGLAEGDKVLIKPASAAENEYKM